MSSFTTLDVVVVIFKASLMDPASLLSLTPNLNLDFFWMGNDSDKKSISSCGALPVIVVFMIDRATFDDSNG